MQDWVALLRGVNVGGVKVLMADLRAAAEGLGWADCRTYIASGNLLFRAAGTAGDLAAALTAALAARIGRGPDVLVVSATDMRAALAACPFEPGQGSHVHVFFLFGPAHVDLALRDQLIAPTEALEVEATRVWLLAPAGVGRSILAEKLHKVVSGTAMTGRNLNTLRALVEMLDGGASA